MEKDEIIVTIIAAVLGSGVLNGIITHFLYNNKLKKEQKMKAKDAIWGKIDSALEEIRTVELKASARDIYNLEDSLSGSGYTDFQNDIAYYPAIMEDPQTLLDYFNELNETRRKWSKYLDPEICAYLYIMQNYCMQLMEYTKKNNLLNKYHEIGCVFFIDILNWQKNYEKLIVERLNRSKYKLYTENGRKWERAKKRLDKKLWKKSILYKLINDIESEEIILIKSVFQYLTKPEGKEVGN